MIAFALNLAIAILVLGLCYAIVTWALGLAGVPVPTRIVQIVFALIILIYILSFFAGYGNEPFFGAWRR